MITADETLTPQALSMAIQQAVEEISAPGSVANRSSRISSLLRPFTASPLVQRMMFHLALADGSPGRSRFVAEVLTSENATWLAKSLAENALPSATKTWQRRRLEALRQQKATLPAALGERGAYRAQITSGGGLVFNSVPDEGLSAIELGQALDFRTWLEQFVAELHEKPLGMHRDLLLLDVDPAAPSESVIDILISCQLLPATATVTFSSADQCSSVLSSVTETGFPTRATLAVRTTGHAFQIIDAGGSALLDVMPPNTLHVPSHGELATLGVIQGAVELLCDPNLRGFRALVAESLRAEHRTQLPLFTSCRGFTRLLHFQAAGKAAGELRESLAGHLLEAGFAAEALALLQDVPKVFQGKYFRARSQRAHFALANFAEAASIDETHSVTQEAMAATTLLDELEFVTRAPGEALELTPGKVLTILHACAPDQSGGYAVRAQSLLRHLADAVDEHVAYTRPGFPEHNNELEPGDSIEAEFEGVRYRHIGSERVRKSGEFQYMLESLDHYTDVIRRERPSVVHLRSTFVSALPGLIAAKRFGIPVIYEVSGMWELVYEADHTARKERLRAQTVRLENATLAQADTVVTITEAMARIISDRVPTKNPIEIVPNAVDVDVFAGVDPDADLLTSLGWTDGAPVIGYIGSFVEYEGLDIYLRALADLRERGVQFHGLFVGDGAVASSLRSLASQHALDAEHLTFTGRVPHDQVARYSAIIDVFAYPRRQTRATEAVSPLKPFEAMAAGKAVIVSDVPALAEIVGGGERGRIVASGSVTDLADALQSVLTDRDATLATRAAAQEWVRSERSWAVVGENFTAHIRALMS